MARTGSNPANIESKIKEQELAKTLLLKKLNETKEDAEKEKLQAEISIHEGKIRWYRGRLKADPKQAEPVKEGPHKAPKSESKQEKLEPAVKTSPATSV